MRLFPPTRFDALPPRWAGILLLATILLVAAGMAGNVAGKQQTSAAPHRGDVALYAKIVDDIVQGRSYYEAATADQRAFGYPLNPVFTVREPLLALALGALPDRAARFLALRILTLAVFAAWGWRLHKQFTHPVLTVAGVFFLFLGAAVPFTAEVYVYFHESWAGLLIALSLALYTPKQWGWSLALGFLAACVRETGALYLVVMAGAALFEGRKHEAAAWTAAIVLFVGVMLLHAHMLASYLRSNDVTSAGWLCFGGVPFLLSTARWNAALLLAPSWVIAAVVPLMLLGAAGWPERTGKRLAAVCLGYSLVFLVLGRLNNSYWGLIVSPLMGISLLMTPGALYRLTVRVRNKTETSR
jgi:hypothetical protein